MPATEEITIDQLDDVIASVVADLRSANYAKPLQDFIPVLERQHAGHFSAQTDPGGQAWRPLAPSTVARKGHSTILVETDEMRQSLVGQSANSIRSVSATPGEGTLTFGTSDRKAAFHQYGTSRIPQREHVGTNDQTLQSLVDGIADASVAAITRG